MWKPRIASSLAVCSLLGIMAFSSTARADEPSADAIEAARSHYERGVKLYEAADYDAARAELERAYAIAPSYRILYNLGQIQLKKADYVGALKNFDLYLSEGGSSIPDVRKAQVKAEIEKLKGLVAKVSVVTSVPGCELLVDDVAVGQSPMKEPILVNPGRRKIGATHAGKLPAVKVVEVVGRDNVTVSLTLDDTVRLVAYEKPTRRVPWIGWGVTAGLAVAAGITGYVALNASNSLQDARGLPNANATSLDDFSSRAKLFGVIADVAVVGAVVAGGISLYYTLRWGSEHKRELDEWNRKSQPPRAATLHWSPSGVYGTF